MEKKKTISEISLLLKLGWGYLWKEKIIWLFSALILMQSLFEFFLPNSGKGLVHPLLSILLIFVPVILLYLGNIGIIYCAFCISTGESLSIQKVFQGIKKYFWKFVVFNFLRTLIFAPCLLGSLFIHTINQSSNSPDPFYNLLNLAIFPLSIFDAMFYFPLADALINNSHIWKNIKNGWSVFTNHFVVLALLGIIFSILWTTFNLTLSTTVILFQSNFDLAAMRNFNFINPALALANNPLYQLAKSTGSAIWQVYSATTFVLAFLKYKR